MKGEGWAPTSLDIKVPNCFKYRHNGQFTIIGFIFSVVLNRFKSRHNACLNYIAFIYFSAVSTRLKYHQNACFRDNV